MPSGNIAEVRKMTSVQEVLEILRWNTVGGRANASRQESIPVVEIIEEGLPFEAIHWLSIPLGVGEATVLKVIGLPRRTYARRKKKGRLDMFESDRLYRLARIFAEAKALFGTTEKASRWLQKKNRALGNRIPLDLLSTDVGAHEVEKVLGRIHHGIFS
jgi:putative toxin-antitoxin system antitoxin component (TIGR02293 family)